MPGAGANGAGPLTGIRVTDFTWAWAGPHATLLLAMLGAEVIKIESRTRLDHSRVRSLMGGTTQGGPDASPLFNDLNLNKRSLTLNLREERSRELVRELVAKSDAVLQNMRPGVLDRLGLGYDDLRAVKPDIIMLSSSAVGATGPERTYAGYAPTFASLSGMAHITGHPDLPPLPLSGSVDLRVGTAAAFATLAALYHRERTGEGTHIDLSSTEVVSSMMGEVFLGYEMNGRILERMGNSDTTMAPHNCYRCRDECRWVTIAVGSEEEWEGLKRTLGDPALENEGFGDPASRWRNQARLDPIIERWTTEREAAEVVKALQAAGVAALPVNSGARISSDPQVQKLEILQSVEHPVLGERLVVRAPWTFSNASIGVRSPAPLLGEHNHYVLAEILGMSQSEIDQLETDGVLN